MTPDRSVPKGKGAKAPAQVPFAPLLFNLQKDIGETTDVAAAHPDVVEKLQALVKKMDEDLGVTGQGPGVRPCGRVESPASLIGHDGKVTRLASLLVFAAGYLLGVSPGLTRSHKRDVDFLIEGCCDPLQHRK